jgi:uncharacterized protein
MALTKSSLSEMMKTAMKSGDKDRLAYCRNLHSAVRKREIDDRKDLTEEDFQKIVLSSIKQRQDSIDQFKKGGREDLVQKEEMELKFLQEFLPPQLTEAEVVVLVESAIKESQSTSAKDMGKVMKILMPKTQGKFDGKILSQLVKDKLGSN